LRQLSDDAVAVMVDASRQAPSPMTIVAVEHYHGQVTRIGPTDTAFAYASCVVRTAGNPLA
jgi:hypothetical protein